LDRTVFNYIEKGSPLYEQAEHFKSDGLTETLLRFYVKSIKFEQDKVLIEVEAWGRFRCFLA
jgi:hypothetical protein